MLSYFASQFGESTDASNCANLLSCIICEKIYQRRVCCINLPGRTIGSGILRLLNAYFSEKEIDWGKCIGVCTDEDANMTSYRLGVFPKIKVAYKEILWTH